MDNKEKTARALRFFVLMFGIVFSIICGMVGGWTLRQSYDNNKDTLEVRTDTVRDTIEKVIKDTLPPLFAERPSGKVSIKVPVPNPVMGDTVHDTVYAELPVVQKEYRRDSLYEAWVTGIKYGDLPRLDSINVTQRTVKETVTNTITVQKRQSPFSIGLQAGYGYGILSGKMEPYVGIGIGYKLRFK